MDTQLRGARFIAASLSVLGFAACGGGGNGYSSPTDPGNQPPVAAATVQATPAIRFTPNQVTLTVGGTVTFAFGAVAHEVFFDNAPPGAPANIPNPSVNKSVTLTFATKGTYVYNCHIHPGMRGTVVVE